MEYTVLGQGVFRDLKVDFGEGVCLGFKRNARGVDAFHAHNGYALCHNAKVGGGAIG